MPSPCSAFFLSLAALELLACLNVDVSSSSVHSSVEDACFPDEEDEESEWSRPGGSPCAESGLKLSVEAMRASLLLESHTSIVSV
jgi:hypothetical protein